MKWVIIFIVIVGSVLLFNYASHKNDDMLDNIHSNEYNNREVKHE